jgi:site-specific DNA-adenine methylase
MIKSPLRYPGGKSRAVETIAKLLPDFDEFREPFLGRGSVFVRGNDLKSQIFITAGERSVACGRKNTRNYCLKGRTKTLIV